MAGSSPDPALLSYVGGHPVHAGLTILPGVVGAPEPPDAAWVVDAGALVRALRLVALAEHGRREHRRVADLEEAELRLRERASGGGPEAGERLDAAERLRRAREGRRFDPSVFVGLMMDAGAARERLATAAGKPLVIVGHHPALPGCMDRLLRDHPQVVHLPDA
jgi:hypothetical protein